jgi:hypothetical protein
MSSHENAVNIHDPRACRRWARQGYSHTQAPCRSSKQGEEAGRTCSGPMCGGKSRTNSTNVRGPLLGHK